MYDSVLLKQVNLGPQQSFTKRILRVRQKVRRAVQWLLKASNSGNIQSRALLEVPVYNDCSLMLLEFVTQDRVPPRGLVAKLMQGASRIHQL